MEDCIIFFFSFKICQLVSMPSLGAPFAWAQIVSIPSQRSPFPSAILWSPPHFLLSFGLSAFLLLQGKEGCSHDAELTGGSRRNWDSDAMAAYSLECEGHRSMPTSTHCFTFQHQILRSETKARGPDTCSFSLAVPSLVPETWRLCFVQMIQSDKLACSWKMHCASLLIISGPMYVCFL